MIRLFRNISSLVLLAVLLLAGQSTALAFGPVGYADATTEFCIAKNGQLGVIGGDYNSATGAFARGQSLLRFYGNGYLEVVIPASPAAPWRDADFAAMQYSEKVKALFSQFCWHFGTENFLLTDLPPPSVLS